MGGKIAAVVIAIALAIAGGMLWFVNRPKPAEANAPLSVDAKAYVRNLKLSEVSMKATESYVGQTVTEIEGKIANAGERTVALFEVVAPWFFELRWNSTETGGLIPIFRSQPMR